MRVVLPEWLLLLDPSLRALVLRHEEEHRRARDPFVVVGAAILVALVPWNVALWWQRRRLRLAIEVDCDGRVLSVHPRTEHYGLLLLAIAQRQSQSALVAALTEHTTDLEWRINAMRTDLDRFPRLAAVGLLSLAAAAIALACSADAPYPIRATAPAADSKSTVAAEGGEQYVRFQVDRGAVPIPGNSTPRYPDSLRVAGREGEVLMQFVVDQSGSVEIGTVKVLRSTDPQFSAAVTHALPTFRFQPAAVQGQAVRQLVQMPFVFSLRKRAGKAK
jgi:TonB family protein